MGNCPFAYRKRGDKALHCTKIKGKNSDYCGNTYYCPQTRQWEATPNASDCPLRQEEETEENP